ncbi:nitrilase-related carbon-nitrogen hydrolase [Archaeoglobus veneficus]|uniref:Nitrilase/cyanide hydratase and apolipoprotein N-acyltransferase n=1 Tax=Archaeoglobus veneficus (strain DSM 11195 / SNP6) TaxID=693661 RepID=F2KNW0_ARCVS|nr:nitrilase-related carbon-nitrogen hydrolase [Archaeoglobus veneficus]AEA47437.1 Nitrilase/cyanide hydratase and apolipoprotein N-acyltransferase [Archaeoglobus veneficus SNP6]
MKVCVVQFETKRSRERNVKKAVGMVKETLQHEPALVVLPEAFNTGLLEENYATAGSLDEELREILEISGECDTVIAAGVIAREKGGLYNFTAIVHRGNIAAVYAKVLPFPLTSERKYFIPGRELVVCDTPAGRLGLLMCYEIRFPEIARKLTFAGAEILVVPSQFPKKRLDHWECLVRARAIENQIFVVGANSYGRSIVADPWGRAIVAEEGDTVLVTEIELEEMQRIRAEYPFLGDAKKLGSLDVRTL